MKLASLRQRLGKNINGTLDFDKEELAYRRLADKGFAPDAVIDVGAYEGEWTRLARKIFGDTPSLMVEAQAAKKPILDRVCADLPLANMFRPRSAGLQARPLLSTKWKLDHRFWPSRATLRAPKPS